MRFPRGICLNSDVGSGDGPIQELVCRIGSESSLGERHELSIKLIGNGGGLVEGDGGGIGFRPHTFDLFSGFLRIGTDGAGLDRRLFG